MSSSARYYGWRVVAACFVLALLSWGFGFYGHGFYLAELKRLHDWPASLIAGASTASYLFSALLVVFVNDALRRLGIAACVLFGATALAGSAAALAFVTEPWQLIAAYLVMSFGWATMSLGAINNILGLWFQQRRGLAISLALNGASFSGVVIVPSLVLVAAASGFATAMLAGAALILALAVPLAFTILRVPPPASRLPLHPLAGQPHLPPRRPHGRGPRRCAASRSGACRRPSRSPSPRNVASSCTRSRFWSSRSAAPPRAWRSQSRRPWRSWAA